MKTVALFKKEIMNYNTAAYFTWLVCITSGCFAFINPPIFIVDIEIAGVIKKIFELSWGLGVAFLMGVVAVLASKIGNQIWEDKLKPAYERLFKKKKKTNPDDIG